MDTPAASQSMLDSLRTVEFRQSLKGYNVEEVDEYLEKAAVEADALHEQVRQMTERLRQASERIAKLESQRREPVEERPAEVATAAAVVTDDTLQRTLVTAQRVIDQMKTESEADAARVVADAQEMARTTVADAEERARTLTNESEQRLREEVTRLESMRGQLATDVETMARHLEQERNRLRAALSEVLKWVDENVQPANSLMAMHPRGAEGQRPPGAAPARGTEPPARPAEAPRGNDAAPSGVDQATRPAARPAPVATGAVAKDEQGGAQVLDLRGPAPGDRT